MKRSRKSQIEHHPLGPDIAAHLAVQDALRSSKAHHPRLPLIIALQFYPGDMEDALRLSVFLADLEPRYRDDFLFMFASRFDVKETKFFREVMAYCSHRFPVTHMRSQRKEVGYPDGAFGIWAGILDQCWRNYSAGLWKYHSIQFIEADGVPLRWDWIDEIKRAHAENLAKGKRVTGARMYQCGEPHIQGSLCVHLSCWGDRLSLRSCPSGVAWDVHHGQVLSSEAGERSPIATQYGSRRVSKEMYVNLSREYAWLPACKDRTAMDCAKKIWIERKSERKGQK